MNILFFHIPEIWLSIKEIRWFFYSYLLVCLNVWRTTEDLISVSLNWTKKATMLFNKRKPTFNCTQNLWRTEKNHYWPRKLWRGVFAISENLWRGIKPLFVKKLKLKFFSDKQDSFAKLNWIQKIVTSKWNENRRSILCWRNMSVN